MKKISESILGKLCLLISGMAMTILMMGRVTALESIITGIVALGFYCYLIIKNSYLAIEFIKYKSYQWLTFVMAILWDYYLVLEYDYNVSLFAIVLGVVAIPMTFMVLHIFVSGTVNVIKESLSEYKVRFIHVLIGTVIIGIIMGIIYNITDVFYISCDENGNILFDVIYTTDCGAFISTDAFLNINARQNDIRQPLFGVLSVPLALISKMLSFILAFIPNIYWIILNTLQVVLMFYAMFLVGKLVTKTRKDLLAFMFMILLSYPVLLFSIITEQYMIAVFWVIVYVYMSIEQKNHTDIALIAATGSMLTSGYLFPIVSNKKFKEKVVDIGKAIVKALGIMAIYGQLPEFIIVPSELEWLVQYTGAKVEFADRLSQFINFIPMVLIAPASIISGGEAMSLKLIYPTEYNMLGIIILILVIASFIVNRKEKIAQISVAWIICSFIVLCVIGWGTAENGLVLYSLYYAWAYITLIFMGIEKLFKSRPIIKYSVCIMIVVVLLVINIPTMYDIIKFGVEYYPTN